MRLKLPLLLGIVVQKYLGIIDMVFTNFFFSHGLNLNSYFRRKVSYKHHEYSSQSQDDSSVAEETLQDNIGSQPTQSLQQESFTPNPQCEEEEVTGKLMLLSLIIIQYTKNL